MLVQVMTAREASIYIEAVERRQGIKLGCPEEAALVRGFLEVKKFKKVIEEMPNCQYRSYLEYIYDETLKEIKGRKNKMSIKNRRIRSTI